MFPQNQNGFLYKSSFSLFQKFLICAGLCGFTPLLPLAQGHDLALRVSLSKSNGRVGDTITCDIKLLNEGNTDVKKTDVYVGHSAGLEIIEVKTTLGSFDKYASKWLVYDLKTGVRSSGITIKYLVKSDGTSAITAEIVWCSEKDSDSTPANDQIQEDDVAFGSITVPMVTCGNDPINFTAKAQRGHKNYQWKRNDVLIPGENRDTFRISAPGSYSYSLEAGGTSAFSAPTVVERGDNPLVDLGDPIDIVAGKEIFIKPDVSGGLPPYKYNWSNDINWDMKRKLKKGQIMNLKVRVTDRRGCFANGEVRVRVL
jgi:hypothetical protein